MIDVLFVLEKFQLLGFLRVFWNRTSYHYKAMFLFPFVVNLFPEFSYFPTIAKREEFARYRFPFDVGVLFGGNYITTSCVVQKTNQPASVVSGVHPKPDTGSGNSLGYFDQTHFDKRDGPGGTSGIPWS